VIVKISILPAETVSPLYIYIIPAINIINMGTVRT